MDMKQPFPLIVGALRRQTTSLAGDWKIIIDPLSSGDASPVAVGVEGAGFYQDRRPANGMELIEYAYTEALTLSVPGDWNSQSDQLFFYEGPIWYRTCFDRPAVGDRHFIYVGAANYAADVYVNGQFAGHHEGGFTPFNVEVTAQLRAGENLLVIKVDNRLSSVTVPTRKTDWFNYGGLTRDVLIVSTPQTFIRDFHCRLVDLAERQIAISVEVAGAASKSVMVALPELGMELAVQLDAQNRGETTFSAPVELWSPASPRLYDVVLSTGVDSIRDRIGFREIRSAEGEILLNGAPIFLRGISMHEETVDHPGRSHGHEDAVAMLRLAQELGANFVRLAHYPHDEATVRAADEMGLLIWSEIPVYWSIDWNSAAALSCARMQLSEMVTRDRNRAAVIIWSVANETPMSDSRLAFLKTLLADVRALDSSRLVSSALFGNPREFMRRYAVWIMTFLAHDAATPAAARAAVLAWLGEQSLVEADGAPPTLPEVLTHTIGDPIADTLDVVAYNEYLGWYPAGFLARMLPVEEGEIRRAELALMPRIVLETDSGKPLIASEFGADAKAGFAGDPDTVFSEEFQARYYEIQLRMLSNAVQLRGLSPWVLKDFRTNLRTHPVYQQFYNRKGLVSETGQRKSAFSVLRDYYALLKSGGKSSGRL